MDVTVSQDVDFVNGSEGGRGQGRSVKGRVLGHRRRILGSGKDVCVSPGQCPHRRYLVGDHLGVGTHLVTSRDTQGGTTLREVQRGRPLVEEVSYP